MLAALAAVGVPCARMDPLRFVGRAALAVWLLGGAGCSIALETDAEQCSVPADCTARGAAFANTTCVMNVCQAKPTPNPKWGCIGDVQPLPSGGMTPVTVQLVDLLSMAPLSNGLTISLCAKLDPQCASALMQTVPDTAGSVSVTVPSDFDGYLDIVDSTGTYLPSLIFLDLVAVAQNSTILLVTANEEKALVGTADITLVPNTGLLLVPVVDCTSARTAGVSVSVSPATGSTLFYVIANTPSTSATETDSAGNAGFVNVTPGDVTITGTLDPGGQEMGTVTTIVRAGALTYQLIRPTPL
jgi:hypothetical protein